MYDAPSAPPSAAPTSAYYAYYNYYLHHPVARRAELQTCVALRNAQLRVTIPGSPAPFASVDETQRCAAAARAQAAIARSVKDSPQ